MSSETKIWRLTDRNTEGNMNLTGKVTLVTGASRGIGRQIALTLAGYGATVIVNYNGSAAKAEEVVNEITANGGMAESMQCSVSDFEKSKEMIDGIVKKYGRLDILVNNAGVSDSTPIDKYTAERFASVMDLNVNAMMNGILPTVAIMKEQGGGCILNTSSMVSICGQPGGVAYPSSKYAVNGLTWSLARELGPFHIRVNAVAPGITRTDMVAALPKEMIDPLINRIPLRRIGEADDIANAFLFLASDMASYVTGEILSDLIYNQDICFLHEDARHIGKCDFQKLRLPLKDFFCRDRLNQCSLVIGILNTGNRK